MKQFDDNTSHPGFTAILLQFSFANWIINYPIVSSFATNWHIGELGGGGGTGVRGVEGGQRGGLQQA